MPHKIYFRGSEIPVEITYKQAMFDFKNMGLNLLKIFQDEKVIATILTDDETMINLWFYYVQNHCSTLEDAISDLTSEKMQKFRDIFLDAVLGFINPQMRPALKEIITMMKEELASPGEKLRKAYSVSSPEQE